MAGSSVENLVAHWAVRSAASTEKTMAEKSAVLMEPKLVGEKAEWSVVRWVETWADSKAEQRAA